MSGPATTGRTEVSEASVPQLPKGVRLHHDKPRDRWVLQAPERLFVLDPIALEIVKRCDGTASVAAIVDDLAAAYAAPRETILADVNALLQDLMDKRVLTA
jgi:pyrroloquinoline quinone biosynthesis protein D